MEGIYKTGHFINDIAFGASLFVFIDVFIKCPTVTIAMKQKHISNCNLQ